MRLLSFVLSTVALLFTGCDNELENNRLDPVRRGNSLNIKVLADCSTKELVSSTYFPSGSEIGVCVQNTSGGNYDGYNYSNVKFTATGADANQTWNGASSVMLSMNQGLCYAYYPYNSSVTDITSISVSTSTQKDYMYAASTTVNANNRTATLTMKHALAAVRFAIKKGTYTGTGAVTKVSVQSSALGTSAKLNAKNGNLTSITGTGSAISVSKSLKLSTTAQNVDVIVVPVGSSADLTLSVTIDGKVYAKVISGAQVLKATCNTYTLTVNAGEISLSGIKIGNWTYNSSGSPILEASGYTITFQGVYNDLLFNNEINEDGEVVIQTRAIDYNYSPRAVTATNCSYSQTLVDGLREIKLFDFTGNVELIFSGAGTPSVVTQRFYPSGSYNWVVPDDIYEVDVFLVGGGGGGLSEPGLQKGGSGGGYTKTYKGHGYVQPSSGTWMGTRDEGKDGDAIRVTPGQIVAIQVGAGGKANQNGSPSYFMNSTYQANGGYCGSGSSGGSGGSGGGAYKNDGAVDGNSAGGSGQGHTTRDFGEWTGTLNAAGSAGDMAGSNKGGYSAGSGYSNPYSGYGGAGCGIDGNSGGGDGTVLIRYYVFE